MRSRDLPARPRLPGKAAVRAMVVQDQRRLASRLTIVISTADDYRDPTRSTDPAATAMSRRAPRISLSRLLAEAAAAYQTADVIPHCASCSRPCCRLDPLVLELDWKQFSKIWEIKESRPAFDRRLAAGRGPADIRAAGGLYFAHGKACPAYDEAGHSCRVYGQDVKPAGCSDFPVYEDGGSVVADLRCEAVDLDALVAWMARAVGPDFRIVRSANHEFPFLVTLSVRRAGK